MSSQKITREAAHWFAHMQNVSEDDLDEHVRFESWLLAHPMHAAAYQRLASVWDELDSPQRIGPLTEAALEERALRRSRRQLLHKGALGAVAAFSAGAIGWRQWQYVGETDLLLETDRGSSASTHILPDGSRVTLGAATRIEVRYRRGERLVELQQGVAAFDVQADAQRPFVVDCQYTKVTVLGTHFAVDRMGERHTRVSVDRGRVRVGRMRPWLGGYFWEEREHWILTAGQVVDVTEHQGSLLAIPAADGFAWQQGAVVFSGATLGEIATRLNRHSRRPIRALADSLPGGQPPRIVAVVRFEDIDQFIGSLPRLAAVEVRQNAGSIDLSPR